MTLASCPNGSGRSPETAALGVELNGRFTRDKLTAALEQVCGVVGLDPSGATLLRFTNNAVFLLAASPVVVRIVGSWAMRHRVAKVVRIAAWLAEHDVPAVRLLPGVEQPVQAGAHVATFWQAVVAGGPAPTCTDLARLLAKLHELPPPSSFPLPRWMPLDDVRRRLADAEELDPDDRIFLEQRCDDLEDRLASLRFALPESVVHGDAHLGNLIPSPHGPVICDFDSTCIGPREWDLTPIPVGVLRFGTPRRWQRQLAKGYGFDVTRWDGFEVLREVRELKLTTSVLPILRSNPDVRTEFSRRLRSFRRGDAATGWAPYR